MILPLVSAGQWSCWPNQCESRATLSWAQFIGAVIVLSSVLSIPTVLIVRLIAFQEARLQALDFFKEKKEQAIRFYTLVRSVSFRRVVYAPQVDDEERYTEESSQTPYVSAFIKRKCAIQCSKYIH